MSEPTREVRVPLPAPPCAAPGWSGEPVGCGPGGAAGAAVYSALRKAVLLDADLHGASYDAETRRPSGYNLAPHGAVAQR